MEENKRVYPRGHTPGKWLNYLLLFLSATVLLSGFFWRGTGEDVHLSLVATPTPIPTDAVFDETMESREMTLPAVTWYALQLGAFDNEELAAKLAQTYQARGAAGYVWQDTRYRALAALYPTKEDIQAVRSQLSTKHYIETYSYEIGLPPLKLRMRGMKGQLDIIEAGFVHGQDLVEQLQGLSILMDQREVSAAEAMDRLKALGGQMETVSLRLQERFTPPRHQAVQGLLDCFAQYTGFCDGLDAGDNSVELATQVKYQAIAALDALKKIYDGLAST
ncbi:MAG: SPOR domain-containing protein [Candidatus Limiplasma sp.]|nr:SPOR domain-containing protein [Candidatus Limiplasma sp.]